MNRSDLSTSKPLRKTGIYIDADDFCRHCRGESVLVENGHGGFVSGDCAYCDGENRNFKISGPRYVYRKWAAHLTVIEFMITVRSGHLFFIGDKLNYAHVANNWGVRDVSERLGTLFHAIGESHA